MTFSAALFKAGGSAVVVAVALLRGCTPALEEPAAEEEVVESVAEHEQATTDLEADAPPPGPPVVAAADLEPFAADDPRSAGAEAYRQAMTALDSGDLVAALEDLRTVDGTGFAPALVAWRTGSVLQKLGRATEAEAAWAAIPPDSRLWTDATLARASLALSDGRPNGTLRILGETGPVRPEGATDAFEPVQSATIRADILRSKALRARAAEGDLQAAYRACVRVWVADPSQSTAAAEARACRQELEPQVPEALRPGLTERVARAGALGSVGAKDGVIALLDNDVEAIQAAEPETACAGLYELGRAWHKKKKYSRSTELLAPASEDCPEGETRIRAHYLLAQGLDRSGKDTEAIASWISLAERYPEHSYADDGLYHAGELYAALGNTDDAIRSFESAVARFPGGDMVGAGMWRAAWTALQEDRPADALPWLELQAAGDTRGSNRGRILQGRYWLAHTRLKAAADDAAIAGALDDLEALADAEPLHWYGVLSLWKLHALDPARGQAVAQRTRTQLDGLQEARFEPESFVVEQEFLDAPGTAEAVELLRGGLGAEATTQILRALGDDAQETWSTETLLFSSHLLELADDHHHSHHVLRLAFREEWPLLTPETRSLMSHAYPLAFHDPIVEVTGDYEWPAMTFQGLVREESAFSPTIRSWAGAMGLSQLMWPTAKATARKMGLRLKRRSELSDPRMNLDIGATYFQGLYERWGGHLPLAMASYNAGPGAVSKWVDARGSMELDAWVETIPYRQTRLYVKRVTSSWQTYHALYGEGLPFVPLRIGGVRDSLTVTDPSMEL